MLRTGARVGKFVATAARFRGFGSRTQTRHKGKRTSESAPITYDNDFKTDYRYRRMPRRKRRRWVRFVKKVNHVTLRRQQGLQKVLFTTNNLVTTNVNTTGFTDAVLYPIDGDSPTGAADVSQIFRGHLGSSVYNSMNDLSVVGNAEKRLQFESAQLEVTLRNMGSDIAIVEVYYCRTRKEHGQTSSSAFNRLSGIYQLGFVKQQQIFDLESSLVVGSGIETATTIGTTPFQSPRFCQHFKILKRKKYQIAVNNMISFILKDPKDRMIEAGATRGKICMPGLTHGYLIQIYGAPSVQAGPPPVPVTAQPATVLVTTTRKYGYYMPIYSKDQSAIVT